MPRSGARLRRSSRLISAGLAACGRSPSHGNVRPGGVVVTPPDSSSAVTARVSHFLCGGFGDHQALGEYHCDGNPVTADAWILPLPRMNGSFDRSSNIGVDRDESALSGQNHPCHSWPAIRRRPRHPTPPPASGFTRYGREATPRVLAGRRCQSWSSDCVSTRRRSARPRPRRAGPIGHSMPRGAALPSAPAAPATGRSRWVTPAQAISAHHDRALAGVEHQARARACRETEP